MTMIKAITYARAIILLSMQISGAIFASYLVSVLFPSPFNVRTTLSEGTSVVRGIFIEAVLSAELVFTIFMLAKEKHKATFMAPIGIGLALFVAELVGVFYTGGRSVEAERESESTTTEIAQSQPSPLLRTMRGHRYLGQGALGLLYVFQTVLPALARLTCAQGWDRQSVLSRRCSSINSSRYSSTKSRIRVKMRRVRRRQQMRRRRPRKRQSDGVMIRRKIFRAWRWRFDTTSSGCRVMNPSRIEALVDASILPLLH